MGRPSSGRAWEEKEAGDSPAPTWGPGGCKHHGLDSFPAPAPLSLHRVPLPACGDSAALPFCITGIISQTHLHPEQREQCWQLYYKLVPQKAGSPPRYLLDYYSDSIKHQDSGVPSRFSGSKDASANAGLLLLSGLQPEDEADYYCAEYHGSGAAIISHSISDDKEVTVGSQQPVPPCPSQGDNSESHPCDLNSQNSPIKGRELNDILFVLTDL
ncbi:Immunoglobulin lambda variable 5-52 [Camelus dromedarius]|nr:Immunoglobulin lambda variable 5-52 [Camelus dromedarius]